MHSQRVLSFFFTNRTRAPHGEVFGLMNPLSSNSCNWTLSSYNSTSAILCGVIEMGKVPGCNSILKSTTLYGGNPGSSSGKTSSYAQTTRGRSKSGLTSSSSSAHNLASLACLCNGRCPCSSLKMILAPLACTGLWRNELYPFLSYR